MKPMKPLVRATDKLIAVVSYERSNSDRCPTITKVQIKLGDKPVASATLGGKYSQVQAIREFRHNPKRFNHEPLSHAVQALGLAAA